jgi:hypothetical protein
MDKCSDKASALEFLSLLEKDFAYHTSRPTVCKWNDWLVPALRFFEQDGNSPKPKKKKKAKGEFAEDSDPYRLAKLLYDLIIERKPDLAKKNMQVWALSIDRMIRLQKRPPERIEQMIRWCQADSGNGKGWSGWQNNILCTATLREKYDKLDLEMGDAGATTQDCIDCGARYIEGEHKHCGINKRTKKNQYRCKKCSEERNRKYKEILRNR